MDNMTKESEADLKSDTFGDSLVVTVWAIASIYGIVTNLMVLLAITRHRAIRHSASYWIMASLAVCDIVMLFVCLLHVIPATLWHQRFMEIANFRNIIGMFIYNVFCLLTMSICYGAILIKVRRSHQTTRQYMAATPRRIQPSNREMRLFVQFFFVSLVFLITFVTWQWLPRISVSKWIYFVCTTFCEKKC
ncbi:C-C chemokine receptor type [Trichinella pseudospiralis]